MCLFVLCVCALCLLVRLSVCVSVRQATCIVREQLRTEEVRLLLAERGPAVLTALLLRVGTAYSLQDNADSLK